MIFKGFSFKTCSVKAFECKCMHMRVSRTDLHILLNECNACINNKYHFSYIYIYMHVIHLN